MFTKRYDEYPLCPKCQHPLAMHSDISDWINEGPRPGPCRSHINFAGTHCGCMWEVEDVQNVL